MSFKKFALTAFTFTFLSGPSWAVNIVTLYGDNVSFTFDEESAYGEGMVVGDSIFFLPTDFIAESLNGEGTVTANETINIRIVSTVDGQEITTVALAESGDYQLTGSGSSVDASGLLAVTSNTQNNPAGCPPFCFPYRDEETFTAADFGDMTVEGPLTEWSAQVAIELADTAGWGSDTDVTATMENLLSATTLNFAEEAFIQKKFGAIGIVVEVIPLPAAAFLFPSALMALGFIRRRRLT